MALDDISPSTPNVEPMIKSPLRIILHIQPDIRRNSETKLKESCLGTVNAFFDHIAPRTLHHGNTYIHFPSLEERWGSQVIIDYCTGDILEGSIADDIPLLIYIVSQKNAGPYVGSHFSSWTSNPFSFFGLHFVNLSAGYSKKRERVL